MTFSTAVLCWCFFDSYCMSPAPRGWDWLTWWRAVLSSPPLQWGEEPWTAGSSGGAVSIATHPETSGTLPCARFRGSRPVVATVTKGNISRIRRGKDYIHNIHVHVHVYVVLLFCHTTFHNCIYMYTYLYMYYHCHIPILTFLQMSNCHNSIPTNRHTATLSFLYHCIHF